MSFAVQVWAQPADIPLPRDGFEADSQRLLLRQSGESGPAEFHSLLHSLREHFPSQEDDPLWTVELHQLHPEEPVLDIGLRHDSPRFDAAINFAISKANGLGLHLADSVSGIVHLANGSVIGEADEVLVFAAPDAPRPPTTAPRSIWDDEGKISVYPDLPGLDDAPTADLAVAPPPTLSATAALPELTDVAELPARAGTLPSAFQLRREAEQGNPHAAYELGLTLHSPEQGEPDRAQAVYWFQRGAEAGDPHAAAMLGACLLEGQGTGRDTIRARQWLERAQAGGDSTAQFQLGRMLVAGWGGPAEPERGVKLYLLAAAQGHPDAIFNLASCLDAGYGHDQDRVAAKALFLRARALGSPLRAAGLRVKQREIDTVRALAKRFEVSADIPILIEERRVERALVRTLARKTPKSTPSALPTPATPSLLPLPPVAAPAKRQLGLLALIFSGLGMPLVLLLMSGSDRVALFGTLGVLAGLGIWGGWEMARHWRPGPRGALAVLAAVPGLGLLIGAVLLLRFGQRLSWPQTDASQTRQG